MNLIENGNIDWPMFGMCVKNYRRDKGLTSAQFAEMINRVNGGDKEIINEATVDRIEAGKAKPTIDQLIVFDKMVGYPTRTQSLIQGVAESFMRPNQDVPQSRYGVRPETSDDIAPEDR